MHGSSEASLESTPVYILQTGNVYENYNTYCETFDTLSCSDVMGQNIILVINVLVSMGGIMICTGPDQYVNIILSIFVAKSCLRIGRV